MKKISVWIKRPGSPPRHVWVSDTLNNLQKLVGGYIETVTLADDLVVICNEEGRLRGLPFNCQFGDTLSFVGDIIIAGIKEDEFADCPLDVKGMKKLFPQLWEVKST